MIGGASQDTNINALDILMSTGDMVAVGHTYDIGVKGFTGFPNQSPLMLLYEGKAHSLQWGVVYKLSKYQFNGVAFSFDGLKIVTHTYNFMELDEMIFIANANNGQPTS